MVVNKCKANTFDFIGICQENVTSEWIINQSGFPYMKLDITIPTDVIHDEIKNIEQYFVEHRESYAEHQGWKGFCIHGKSYDATREDQYYNDNRPYTWTSEAIKYMPRTVDFFSNHWFGNTFQRLRVMKLEPGGHIFLHRDVAPPGRLYPVNISITQPEKCDFVFEDYGVVPFSKGDSYILNIANSHCVLNDSDYPRYHIIAHHLTTTDKYNTMLVNSFTKYIDETSTTNN